MNNDIQFNTLKIFEKYKIIKSSNKKILYVPNSVNNIKKKKKINNNKNKINKFEPQIFLQKNLSKKYNTLPQKYSLIQIDNFIKGKYYHSASKFKDYILFYDTQESLIKYYTKNESIKHLKFFSEFYKSYILFFCLPTLRDIKLNELFEDRFEIKALIFYKKNYESNKNDKEKNKNDKEKNKNIDMVFFTDKMRKDISRNNTLFDLSKTSIKLNKITNRNSTRSIKTINSIIKEMNNESNNTKINLNLNKINIVKKGKNENLIYKNIFKNKQRKKNIITNSGNVTAGDRSALNKKLPKIKLDLCLIFKNMNKSTACLNNIINKKNMRHIREGISISSFTNRSKQNITINYTNKLKPLLNKINIVNNKIIIINNHKENKENIYNSIPIKKKKNGQNYTKTKLDLSSRNYINSNHFFGLSRGGTYDLFTNFQNKTSKKSSKKYIDKSRKPPDSAKNHKNLNKKNKEINQNSNSIKLKEKNLILKKKFYQKNKAFNDNNETNSNLNTSRFKVIKTDRNNSREKLNKKVSFFQIFKNNIKNFNKIKFVKNISDNRCNTRNFYSNSSLLNKNSGNIQQILKNNTTLNSMGRIGKSINKRASKNVSTGKCINQKKIIKTQNLKINSILRNNNSNVLNIKSFKKK